MSYYDHLDSISGKKDEEKKKKKKKQSSYYDHLDSVYGKDEEDDIAPVSINSAFSGTWRDKWGKYTRESDFAQYSDIGAKVKNPTVKEAQGYANIFGWRPGAEEVENIVTYSRENAEHLLMGELSSSKMVGNANYRWMTDEEVSVYNYLLAKNGKEKAQEFLDDIEEELNRRSGTSAANNIKNVENGVAKTIVYGATAFGSGLEGHFSGLKQKFTKENLPTSSLQFASQDLAEDLDGYKGILYSGASTIGQMAPSMAVSSAVAPAVGILGSALGLGSKGAAALGGVAGQLTGSTMQGLSAAGNAYGTALDEGYSEKQARLYGDLVGASEGALQFALGGISKLGGKVIGKAIPGIANLSTKIDMIDNSLLRIAAKYGESTVKEVGEEELQLFLEPLYRKIVFGEEYEAPEVDEILETALVTMLTTGVLETGSIVQSEKSMDSNARTVVKSLVEKEIAAKESEGKKLSAKDKNKIYDSVVDQMEKGQIDIDTIESTLGGESYKAYTDQVNTEENLKKELEELSNIETGKLTRNQQKRLAELESMNLDDTTKRDGLRKTLDDTLSPMLKGSKLTESYRERARRGQAFEADPSKYTGKQREAVERAVKSGVLNNTYRSHELVDVLSKIEADKGIAFDYTNNAKLKETGFAVEGKTVNGYANKSKSSVTLNVQSSKAWQSVVGHEITHILEGTEAYSELQNALYAYAESKGELANRRAYLTKLYQNMDADIDSELTADLVGDYLFTDKDFVNKLTGNRTLFQKIYDEIKYLWNVATGKEKAEIEIVKDEFDRVWKEFSAQGTNEEADSETKEYSDSDVKYSIREEAPPKETGIAYKVFFVKDGKLYPPMVANPDGADTPMGVWLNADVGEAAPPSKTGRAQVKAGGKGTQGGSGSLAFRPGWHLGDLPRASQFDRVNPETGKKELFPENFVWAEVEYAKDVDYQEEAMSYGYTENGKFRHSYAGLPKLPENGYYRYRTNPRPDTVPWVITGAMKVNRLLSDAEVNEILEKNGVPAVHRQGGDVELDKFGFDGSGKGVRYSLSANAEAELHNALYDRGYEGGIRLRDETPSIMASQKGVKNLPMTMKVSHIRENVFSEKEARKLGLTVDEHTHYHGLGEKFFLQVIDGLDNVTEAYRGTKNASDPSRREDYFLLISEFNDKNGNTINVPVYINEHALYNRVFIDVNKISTVFGRDGFRDYINRQIRENNLVRIKNRSTQTSESKALIASDYEMNASVEDSIAPLPENVNTKFSLSADSDGKQLSAEQQEYFRDSKVRDENGNLKVMYHGTPNGDFTVFRDGTYFTENKWYADLYQNPGASSLNSRKVASNPKTYKVYLDIKKPFDISDAEARDIYINEYIKGGNAIGINPYLSDAEYAKIDSIDWTEGEDLRDYLVDNGYDYDGLVLDEGAVGGYGDDVKYRGKSYVTFSPEQVKDVDNKNPTTDPDIRFSLSNSVEETKDLVAIHNLQASELVKTLELGGLPMPSIAVIKAQQGHEQYGDVSLIFPKDTIDPQRDSSNKVYGGDAWTPTYPRIEYKPSEAVAKKISGKYYELASKIGYDEARPMYRYAHELEEALNRDGGEAPMLEKLYEDTGMMQVYLQDSGKGKIDPITNEIVTRISDAEAEMNQFFIDVLGEDFVAGFKAPEGVRQLMHGSAYLDEHGAEIREAYKRYFIEVHGFTQEEADNALTHITKTDLMKIILGAYRYTQNKGVTVRTETDYEATEKAIRTAASDGYKEWVNGLFKGIEEKSGIRNNQDYYTRSGNPRSWDALHWENTLENVVKVMKGQEDTGVGSFSPFNTLLGASHKRYGSIQDIKADSNRLGKINQEEYEAMKDSFSDRFAAIAESIKDPGERNPFIATDTAAEQIVEAVRTKKTKDGILSHLKKYNSRATMQTVDDVVSLVSDIANMPTGYFEAKPKRAVGLEEVGVFVIPRNADAKLKQELLNRGYSIAEYDPNVEGDRQRVVNQFEEYKFSLSNVGEEYAPIGDYAVYGKDIKYSTPFKELALEEDIAPVAPTKATEAPSLADIPVLPDEELEGGTYAAIKPNKEKPAVPKSERIADGSRSDELLNESLDNYPMKTIEQKVAEKIRAVQGEIADKQDLRKESWDDYEKRIAELRAKYNSKKNKNTKEARGILESIARQERLKADREAEYAKRISDLEARVERMSNPKYGRALHKRAKMEADAKWAADLLGDTSTWKDKKIGLQYATNTERRNLRDIVRDENGNVDIARADAIDDALSGRYNREEADKKRELAKSRKKYADLKITKAEDAYIQMLGELRHNPGTSLTEQAVKEYYEKHKDKIDTAKVDKVIEMARQDYDSWLNRVNAELKKQGMKEIPYRQGYFPHFTEPKQNFIQKLLNWKVQDNEIPTSIAGLTETFKPNRSWQSFDKKRYSDETDYSFMKGFDSYSEGVLDWIYHMDTLQKRRAVENHIRFTHSDEGIQARIKEVYASEDMDANEAQAQIEHILTEAKNPLNNFVQDFTTHTNILAGKKNSLDRTVEQWTNRHIYSVMTNVQNRMSANLVLANAASALSNFIPITQSWAQVSPIRSLQAVKQTIANSIKDDGTVDKSTFLTNRLREPDKLYQTNWDKVLDKAGIMFEIVDNFSSQVIWRSKYNQNLARGMSESEAIKNADQFAENVMAGRSKGNEPTLFNAKNPFVKAFTMFQLEVNNQYGYLFKDVPNDLKAETEHWKLNLAKGYTAAFVGAYIYNSLLEKVTGRDAALDPIAIVEDLLRDLGLLGDDEEEEPAKIVSNFVGNVAEELPFVGGLLGGGRVPISSALPYSDDGLTGFMEDVSEGNWGNVGKEMMNPVLNVGLPVAGGQLKKTYQGLNMFSDEHPVSGSYTDSGKLRFPVEDTPLNRIQAGIFGQYASKNAREYFDGGYAPLSEKQIQEYIDVDMPIKDYWKYRDGLKKQETLEDKFDYISGLDLPVGKKNILINNVVDRKEAVNLENYDDFASLEEFDFATKNPDKYAFAKSVGGYSSYKTYRDELYDIKADKDANGKTINGSRKEKVFDYINNLDADFYTKIILFKSEYPSDDTYNQDIVNHIVGRADLTYDERVAILTELGFRVTADGQIYAD